MLRSFGGDVQGRHHAGVRLPCSEYRARRRCEPVTRSPCESLASARKLPTGVYRVCTGCGFHASPSHARSASRGALHSGREVGWRVMRDDGEEPFKQRVAGSIPARLIRFSAPDAERRRAGECTAAAGDGPRVPPHWHPSAPAIASPSASVAPSAASGTSPRGRGSSPPPVERDERRGRGLLAFVKRARDIETSSSVVERCVTARAPGLARPAASSASVATTLREQWWICCGTRRTA